MPKCCTRTIFQNRTRDVTRDINVSQTWYSDTVYVIRDEVHVRAGSRLTIQDGTVVQFAGNRLDNAGGSPLPILVVDSGASIVANDVVFESLNGATNSTGGLILLGTISDAFSNQFENYTTIVSDPTADSATSVLTNNTFLNLGETFSDLNALTLFKVQGSEVQLSNLNITNAGDDGLEIFGGSHTIDNLVVEQSVDDGIDLDFNAILDVTESLFIRKFDTVGPASGLVEVIGEAGTTNRLNLAENALYQLAGVITDQTAGATVFAGSFAGLNPQDIVAINGAAIAGTFIEGTI